ncbi:MAG: hypothetical protein AAGI01_19020 [Myxococcota bacterium]
MIVMRVLSGLYLIICAMIVLTFLGDAGPLVDALRGESVARASMYVTFGLGVFAMMPQVWSWRDERLGPITRVFNTSTQAIWVLAGVLSAAFGVFFLGNAALAIETYGAWVTSLYLLTAWAYMTVAAGLIRPVWASKQPQHAQAKGVDPSNIVLRVAKTQGGYVTPAEIAAETTMHYNEAKVILEQLRLDGMCDIGITEQNVTFYVFPEFAQRGPRRDILERDVSSSAAEVVFDHEPASSTHSERRAAHERARSDQV